jgi:chromate transporter
MIPAAAPDANPTADTLVPAEPLARLFLRYLRFGALAWGGPAAQLAMIRQELVSEKKWVSNERFNRTLAVYQVLPGPEAHEVCVHYGMLSRGRLGGLLAGLGFMLPGFILMFLLSFLYVEYGLTSSLAVAALAGMRPAVVALIVRATHRLADHALHDKHLIGIGIVTAVATFLGAPFFVTLPLGGTAYVLARRGVFWVGPVIGVVLLGILGGLYAAEVMVGAEEARVTLPAPVSRESWLTLFGSGLKAGLLTFGGAYTVIPFLENDATGAGGWMTEAQFLEGVALGGVLPAPLIIFATFVGYVGGGPAGALAMTVGIFLPAFGFTLMGQRHLERWISNVQLHAFLDGVTAGVIGLISVTAIGLFTSAVRTLPDAATFAAVLALQYAWKAKAAVPMLVVAAGLCGMILERA